MRISGFGGYAFTCCVAVAMLAGCGGGSGTPLSPSAAVLTAERTHVRPVYGVLYSFKGGSDGEGPSARLIDVKGTFYATTYQGGANNAGTIFSVTPSGKETVLHSFGAHSDGTLPQGALINVNGMLYGTTSEGGANCYASGGCGTVFEITPSGKRETVLHNFDGSSSGSGDGATPEAGLIDVNGTLYSTTYGGGANCYGGEGCGTVFAITTSGAEGVIHSFYGGKGDGENPEAGLTDVNGTLYGTTSEGGANCERSSSGGCGTVFAITTSGTEAVIHSFGAGTDGRLPQSALVNLNGTLYGTTASGGTKDHGTVFSITTAGTETVLHSFNGRDGADPYAHLINVKGTLYGTTYGGGAHGDGTVFQITTSGAESVLHSFGGPGDGQRPIAGILDVGGTFYGTTAGGGANGDGTVFSLSP
ncbi:MAG TPA: choice-of-anchor tandem repeat GloVer-containing protein [Candidatus Cybelea sp.]|nr:choice-of-anchor tandem repeat GloVer-containing protein [Candidatus Cybelea sp.]